MKYKINKTLFPIEALTCFLFIGSLFQMSLFRYVDEIVAFLSIAYITLKVLPKKKDKFLKINFAFVLLLLLIGLLSNVFFDYEYSWIYVLEDIFMFLKPFAVFAAFYAFFNYQKRINDFHLYAITISKLLIVIVFIGLVVSYFFNIQQMAFWDSWATFKFIKTYVFVTGYPGLLAVFLGVLVMVLLTERNKKNTNIYITMALVSVFCTQSGIGFVAIFLYVMFALLNGGKKLRWYHIVVLSIGGIAVGWNEIHLYLLNSNAARSVMLRYGFTTAKNLFPLGSGFSTYGGMVAAKHYAKLYSEYNFGLTWGLAQNGDMDFMHDCYYPYIVGQFGIIGTLTYVGYEFSLFRLINSLKKNNNIRIALQFAFILILVMNFGQGEFGGPIGCLYMIFMALYMKKAITEENTSALVGDRQCP